MDAGFISCAPTVSHQKSLRKEVKKPSYIKAQSSFSAAFFKYAAEVELRQIIPHIQ